MVNIALAELFVSVEAAPPVELPTRRWCRGREGTPPLVEARCGSGAGMVPCGGLVRWRLGAGVGLLLLGGIVYCFKVIRLISKQVSMADFFMAALSPIPSKSTPLLSDHFIACFLHGCSRER
jgi:hypothetical protein